MLGKKIEPSKKTPEVYLGPEGVIKIWGRSISEESKGVFDIIFGWIDEYLLNPADITSVELSLEYFNSASTKHIIKMFQKLKGLVMKHKKLNISWYYEEGDFDILEKGEYISSVLNLRFSFVEIKQS